MSLVGASELYREGEGGGEVCEVGVEEWGVGIPWRDQASLYRWTGVEVHCVHLPHLRGKGIMYITTIAKMNAQLSLEKEQFHNTMHCIIAKFSYIPP